ncbi:hypothetical protein WME94_32325 [Sorangium sp. So ce429]
MKQSYLSLARWLCVAAMAVAPSACGGDGGTDTAPDLDIERSDVAAPLQGGDGSCQLPDGPRSFKELSA